MAEGKFIAFEGLDGSGITTQAELLRGWLQGRGIECYLTKEPTDGPAGSIIRLALARRLSLHPDVLALFFATDRLDHLVNDILDKLKIGITVISDRYVLSSLAYQSVESDPLWLRNLNSRFRTPDLTILIDTPIEMCLKRMQRQRWHIELYEEAGKLENVRKNYLQFAREFIMSGERIAVVDGARSIDVVHRDVTRVVQALYRKRRQPALNQLALESNA